LWLQRYHDNAVLLWQNNTSAAPQLVTYRATQEAVYFNTQNHHYTQSLASFAQTDSRTDTADQLNAPCHALVKELLVSNGDTVIAGQPVIVLEAMKIEQVLNSPRDGIVATLPTRANAAVKSGQVLLTLQKEKNTSDD
jgi:biotin carboxyl carrier protein